jgi:hypothetical protein
VAVSEVGKNWRDEVAAALRRCHTKAGKMLLFFNSSCQDAGHNLDTKTLSTALRDFGLTYRSFELEISGI